MSAGLFWLSFGITHLAAWGFLVLACRILPHTWQDKTPPAKPVRWRDHLQHLTRGSAAAAAVFRSKHLARSPIGWLMVRDRLRGKMIWLMWGTTLAGAVGLLAYRWPETDLMPVCIIVSILCHAFLKIDFGAFAARPFAEERHAGTIELLLATPLRVSEILRGHWLALFHTYRWPVAVLLLGELAMLVSLFFFGSAFMDARMTLGGLGMILVVLLVFELTQLLDLVALGWLGLWTGLNARVPAQAASSAVALVLLLPWGLLFIGLMTMGLLRPPWLDSFGAGHFAALWLGLGLATDLAAIWYARRRLHRDFRIVATERFQPVKQRTWLGV